MNDFIKSVQDVLIARVQNMLLMNFIIAWIFINYKISLTILFADKSIDEKIIYLESLKFDWWLWFLLPLLITSLYIFLIPFLNLHLSKLHDKFIKKYIKKYENEKLIEHYKSEKELSKGKLEATVFVEDDLRKARQEKTIELTEQENKAKLEAVEIIERENKAKQEMIELTNKENKAKQETIELTEKENKAMENRRNKAEIDRMISKATNEGLGNFNQADLSDAYKASIKGLGDLNPKSDLLDAYKASIKGLGDLNSKPYLSDAFTTSIKGLV